MPNHFIIAARKAGPSLCTKLNRKRLVFSLAHKFKIALDNAPYNAHHHTTIHKIRKKETRTFRRGLHTCCVLLCYPFPTRLNMHDSFCRTESCAQNRFVLKQYDFFSCVFCSCWCCCCCGSIRSTFSTLNHFPVFVFRCLCAVCDTDVGKTERP